MARSTRTQTTVTSAPEAPVTEPAEAPVAVTPEAVTEAPTEALVDVTTAPEADVVAAYRTADQSTKARIRAAIETARKTATDAALKAISSGDPAGAVAHAETANRYEALGTLVRTSAPSKAPVAVDYTALVAARVIALRHAADLLATAPVLSGHEVDAERLMRLVAEATDEEGRIVDAGTAYEAHLLATAPVARKSASGPRGDIGQHLAEWAESVPSGTKARVSEVAKFVSSAYPDARPSQGAIAARVWPTKGTCTVAEVIGHEATATAPRMIEANV